MMGLEGHGGHRVPQIPCHPEARGQERCFSTPAPTGYSRPGLGRSAVYFPTFCHPLGPPGSADRMSHPSPVIPWTCKKRRTKYFSVNRRLAKVGYRGRPETTARPREQLGQRVRLRPGRWAPSAGPGCQLRSPHPLRLAAAPAGRPVAHPDALRLHVFSPAAVCPRNGRRFPHLREPRLGGRCVLQAVAARVKSCAEA